MYEDHKAGMIFILLWRGRQAFVGEIETREGGVGDEAGEKGRDINICWPWEKFIPSVKSSKDLSKSSYCCAANGIEWKSGSQLQG